MPFDRTALAPVLLGQDPTQRLRASQALLVLGLSVIFTLAQGLVLLLGLADAATVGPLVAWYLAGGVGFYAVVRSGLNLRLRAGRSLTVPQLIWGMVGVTWSYVLAGPARGAVLPVMVLITISGLFALKPRSAAYMAALGLLMLAGVMVWKARTDPVGHDIRIETLHFAMTAIVAAGAARLALRTGRLRARLHSQRAELRLALQRIEMLATRDELTGLPNRRAALERLHDAARGPTAQAAGLCIGLLDLDHFKRINDSLGHAAGDRVLQRFADLALPELRATDILARWGGEEFLLVMPASTPEQALQVLQRLRLRLKDTPLDDVQRGLRITYSAGVAPCRDEADIDAAIDRADVAMYLAKQAGRDRSLSATQAPRLEVEALQSG